MYRDPLFLKLGMLALAIAIISMMAVQMPQDELLTPKSVEFDISFVLVDKKYSVSNGTLMVSLRNSGKSLGLVTKEDFKWYLDGCAMGTVYSIYFADGKIGKWDKGKTIQIELKAEKVLTGSKIKLAFRDTSIEFSV